MTVLLCSSDSTSLSLYINFPSPVLYPSPRTLPNHIVFPLKQLWPRVIPNYVFYTLKLGVGRLNQTGMKTAQSRANNRCHRGADTAQSWVPWEAKSSSSTKAAKLDFNSAVSPFIIISAVTAIAKRDFNGK